MFRSASAGGSSERSLVLSELVFGVLMESCLLIFVGFEGVRAAFQVSNPTPVWSVRSKQDQAGLNQN